MRKDYWSWWNRFNRKHRRLSNFEKIKYSLLSLRADCILMDTPVHGNYGDHAIVQTQKQILKDMGLRFFEIPFPELMLREKAFSRVISKDKTIIIPGGGFLGYLWQNEENEVRRILKGFENNPVIIFPQTVTFDLDTREGIAFFNESKEIYSAHKNLTLFVRDKASFEFMKKNMPQVQCRLAPDTVTILRPEAESGNRQGILMCFRNDKEKNVSDDCIHELSDMIKKHFPNEKQITTDTVSDTPIYPDERESSLKLKLSEFAAAKLVITDRLHGMIMSAITGTPCIAFNNANGKVKSQYEWIKNNEYIHMVSGPEELPRIIEALDIDKKYSYDYESALENMRPLLGFVEGKISKKG